jgi:hypothetical protein
MTLLSLYFPLFLFSVRYLLRQGAFGSILVKTLCYKPEGRGFETR